MSRGRGFEGVMNVQRMRRGILKQLLAKLRSRRGELAAAQDALRAEAARVRGWSRERLREGAPEAPLGLADAWGETAVRRLDALQARIVEMDAQIADADRRFVAASQDLKALVRLKERRDLRERKAGESREQRDLDELSAQAAVAR